MVAGRFHPLRKNVRRARRVKAGTFRRIALNGALHYTDRKGYLASKCPECGDKHRMLHKNRLGEWSKMTPHVARRKKALVCYLNFPVFAIKVLLLHGRPDRGTGLHYCSKCHDLRRRGYDVLMAAEHELKRELKKLPLPIYWEMWNYLGRDPYVE